MEQKQLDELFERFSQQFSDIALSLAYGIRVPMDRTPMRALASSLDSFSDEERAMVAGRLARMVSDLVPILADAGQGEQTNARQQFRTERGLSARAAAQRALDIVTDFDYGERQRRFGRFRKEDSVVIPDLGSRNPDESYLLYAGGDDRFRPQDLRLAAGTRLGINDLSGMTMEDAFNNVVRPAIERKATIDGITDAGAREEYLYQNGYLPLWNMWCVQNEPAIRELRSHLIENVDGISAPVRVRRLVDPSTESRLSPARALEDFFRTSGRGIKTFSKEDVDTLFSQSVILQSDPRLERTGIKEYDIYSIGTGQLQEGDFWRLVPEDTDVMVVFAATKKNQANAQFSYDRFNAVAKDRGIAQVDWPALGGETKPQAMMIRAATGYTRRGSRYVGDEFIVEHDGVKYVDYGALGESPDFQKAVDDIILKYAREGKKVCVVGSATSAVKGETGAWRGLLLGQYVETHTPYRVAHIDGGHDGLGVRVASQEEVCMRALPPRSTIINGTTKDMHFLNPVSGDKAARVDLPLGMSVRRKMLPGQDPELRMIEGRLNYGTDVEFRHVAPSSAHVSGSTQFFDSVRENVAYTNFTVVFAAGGEGDDKNVKELERVGLSSRARDHTRIAIPDKADECYDMDVIDRAARRLSRKMTSSVAFQYIRFGKDKVDLDNVKVYVTGSSEPRIANQKVNGLTNGDENGGVPQDFKEERPLGPSQDDVNYFVTEVFRRAFIDRPATIGVDGEDLPFRIGEIHSHYDSGAGEAGITAAQHLAYMQRAAGLRPFHPVVISTNDAVTVPEGDSIFGRTFEDPAYFRNRAHRGFVPDVTDAMVIEQVRDVEARREAAEDGMQVGLTDRQVMLLYELGVDNGVMIEAIDLAIREEVTVNTGQDMVEFLDMCRSNGLEVADGIDLETVESAYDRLLDNEDRWREAGISYVTAASPLYPPSMEGFQEYTEMRTRPVMTTDADGSVHVSSETDEYTVRRPAILWCRGDISLLQEPTVGILGGQDVAGGPSNRAAYYAKAHQVLSAVPDDLLRTALDKVPDGKLFLSSDAENIVEEHESTKALFNVVTQYGPAIREVADANPGVPVLQALKGTMEKETDMDRKALLDDIVRTIEVPVSDRSIYRNARKKAVVSDDTLRAALDLRADVAEFTMEDAQHLLATRLYSAVSEYDLVARKALDLDSRAPIVDTVERRRDDIAYAAAKENMITNNDDRALVREFCASVSESDLPVVASIDDAMPKAGVFDTLAMRNGRVVAVTGRPFQYEAEDAVQRVRDLDDRIAALNEAVVSTNVVSEESLRAAIGLHPDGDSISLVEAEQVSKDAQEARMLFLAMSQYGSYIREAVAAYPTDTVPRSVERLRDDAQAERHLLKSEGMNVDVADEVVRKGGLVVSDKAPASAEAPQVSRSQRLVAGIATVAAVFDQIHHAQPMSLLSMTFYTVAGLTYITTRPVEKVVGMLRERHKSKEAELEDMVKEGVARRYEVQPEIDGDREATDRVAAGVVGVTRDGRGTDTLPTLHDAGQMAVEQAYAEREQQQLRRDELAAESISPDGARRSIYSRVKESIASVFGLDFDTMFREKGGEDKAENKDVLQQDSVRALSQLEIEVLSYRGNRFFFVPDSQPHIAAAVRERYGESAKVLDPSLKVKVQESLDLGRVDGQDRFREPEGTQLLPHRCYTYKVYFNDGVIHGINTLPSGLMGLPPKPERQRASVAWKHFMDSMKDLQRDWLAQAGLPAQAGTAQLRCENADYMVFCPNRIEVRRGDELRCFVEFKDGVIKACNLPIKDLSEYHETKAYDILPLKRAGRAEAVLPENLFPADKALVQDGKVLARGFGDYIREALFDRPVAEQEAMEDMKSTREKREEFEEKLSNGFIRIREDNMSIACEDVAKAMQVGRIPDLASFEGRDNVAVYAAAMRAGEQAKAAVRSCDRQAAKIGKQIEAIDKALENKGMTVEKADADREALGAKLEGVYAMRRKNLMEIANMEDVKAGLREGMLPYGLGGRIVLDGVVFGMRGVKPNDEELKAAERELAAVGVKPMSPQPEAKEETPEVQEAKDGQVQEVQVEAVIPEEAPAEEKTEVETPAEAVVETTSQEAVREEEPLSARERLERLDETIAAMTGDGLEPTESEELYGLVAERDAVMKEVVRESIVPGSEHDGIAVAAMPEGQCYCRTSDMEVISAAYPSLKPFGKTVGVAWQNEDGTGNFKLLRRDGSELLPTWFSKLAKCSEPSLLVAVAENSERYFLSKETGTITSGPFAAVQDFSEGRARVMRADGRYNYVNEKGTLMQQSMWFDDATHFRGGVADVRVESPSETTYIVIDKDFHYKQSRREPKRQEGLRQPKKPEQPKFEKKPEGSTPGHPGKK